MDVEGEKWIFLPKDSDKYRKGVEDFVTIAFSKYVVGKELPCPCKTCSNRFWSDAKGIREHLVCNGPCPHYLEWIYEVSTLRIENMIDDMDEMDTDIGMGLGDEFEAMIQNVYGTCNDTGEHGVRNGMDADARKFYRFVNKGRQPLYPESKNFTSLSFIVRLYQLKCIHGFSEAIFSDLLDLIKEAFPNVNVPSSFNSSKVMIKDLGLDYQKIHACSNDCMLFWAENEGLDVAPSKPGWKVVEDRNGPNMDISKSKEYKVPAKVLRYFSLKPWLQRMFMSSDYSNSMIWHALARKKDGKLRHPVDGKGWKSLDTKYPEFGAEMRNVRLGLAADGFNPYRSMNISHSTWLVVLVNYNLPPWLVMKPENLILSTLIPGPIYPSNEIDVYMQPLIKELKELWEVGIETYDARVDNTFRLHAVLLWTISDFPGYAVLSGTEVENLLCGYENDFGKQQKKHRGSSSDCPWKKKSIFFELPYWSSNMVKHNLDVMHIEKNICDKIMGTLLDIGGRIKDHLSAHQDLEEMGIRKDLHPVRCDDNKHVKVRTASFDMTKKEKEIFCSVLMNAKLPHRFASNISRCIQMNERKISGYKSHDAHFILQFLFQFAVVKTLKPEVEIPLMRLGAFFRGICGKVIELEDVEKLPNEIIEILCELEMIFPSAFFDIMVHLPIHLCKEIEFGGPVHLRWMFGVESYLCKLKSYVRNRSKPEGCIAEGEHRSLVEKDAKVKKYKRERTHATEFHKWLKEVVRNKNDISMELSSLARGPHRAAKQFTGYIVNGFRFHTKQRDSRCTTQNSGVFLTALTTNFATVKDKNLIVGEVGYYGAIEDIIEVDYWGALAVVIFRCCWYQKEKDCHGLTRVNFNKLYEKDDPFVLATQVQQVFYVEDPTEKNVHFVIKKFPKDQYSDVEDEINVVVEITEERLPTDDIMSWCRDDVQIKQIPVTLDEEVDNNEI
ncbi:uncharacterized protein LOC141719247 [Apium graveolens]|uniref:uncharacterized protein LOC141719247 n=1 Tax=Apium graveolens TaxID=4045 RepID=UPI003D7ADFBD